MINALRAISLAVIPLLLASCSGIEVYQQSAEFNSAVSSSSNDALFLNIIRASKGYPMQFTKLQTYEGGGSAQATIQTKFPFGPGAINPIYAFDPQITAKSHLNKIALTDLNTQEAQAALRRQATFNEYVYYMTMSGGRRQDVIETMLIEDIEVSSDIFGYLETIGKKRCDINPSSCRALKEFQSTCKGTAIGFPAEIFYGPARGTEKKNENDRRRKTKPPAVTENDIKVHKVIKIINSVKSRCDYLALRAFSDIMNVMGLNMYGRRQKSDPDDDKNKGATQKTDKYFNINIQNTNSTDGKNKSESKKIEYPVTFSDKKLMAKFFSEECQKTEETGRVCLNLNFRSPERVVRYLGEVVAAQTLLPEHERFSPHLYDDDYRFELFHVEKGNASPSRNILYTVDSEGDSFTVPPVDYNDRRHHRNLEALALVADLINGAVSAKDLPQVTSITLSPQ